MSDDRNMDLEEQLSILFDDIDDTAKKAAESAEAAAEKANEDAPLFKEVVDDAFIAAKQEAREDAGNALDEIDSAVSEVKNVRENVEDAASDAAAFVEKEAEEGADRIAESVKAAADDTRIKKEEYKGIDFDSFESVIGDDDDEEALVPEDIPDKKNTREADEEFDDDDEEDQDEIGGNVRRREPSRGTKAKNTKEASQDKKKESAKFWIFTAIVALIVAAAVLFILWNRGIIFGGRDQVPSSQEPSETEPSTDKTEPSETEPSTEPYTEPSTEPSSSETEEPSSETEAEVTNEDVLANYNNLLMVTNADTLNLREQPDGSAKIIGTLERYAGGDLLEQSGEWFRVTSGGLTGYVKGEFIAGQADAESLLAENASRQVRINAENGVNVRASASTEADVLGQAGNNTLWEYLGEEEGFYHIMFENEVEGYVSKDFAKEGWFLKEAAPYYE